MSDIVQRLLDSAGDFPEGALRTQYILATLELGQRIAMQKWQIQQLEQTVCTDRLTGLPNEHAYNAAWKMIDNLTRRRNRNVAKDEPVATSSIIAIDIDNFKQLNDAYGDHAVGDAGLCHLANVMKHGCDLRDSDMPARLHGDEFVVLLPETSLAGALQVAQQIRGWVEAAPFMINAAQGRKEVFMTVSLGVATFTGKATQVEVMKAADEALYDAKEAGRNCVAYSSNGNKGVLPRDIAPQDAGQWLRSTPSEAPLEVKRLPNTRDFWPFKVA